MDISIYPNEPKVYEEVLNYKTLEQNYNEHCYSIL